MDVLATPLPRVYRIAPRVFAKQRGFFLETWQATRYTQAAIAGPFVQDKHSRSTSGTLRGLHYQLHHPLDTLAPEQLPRYEVAP